MGSRTMKCYIFILLFISTILTGYSQDTGKTYRAIYRFEYTTDSINSYTVNDIIHLELYPDQSFCYSKYTWELDSLTSTPQGDKLFEELLTASLIKDGPQSRSFPHRKSSFLISKNNRTNKLCVKDSFGGDYYFYQDSISDFKWNITDISKTEDLYTAIKAVCNYHGRDWIVWFSPELPWHDGPWKFCGLPGLIIEAYDKDKLFHFKLEKIAHSDKPITDWVNTYLNTERNKFNKNKYNYYKNNSLRLNNEFVNSTPNAIDTRYLKGLEPDFKH